MAQDIKKKVRKHKLRQYIKTRKAAKAAKRVAGKTYVQTGTVDIPRSERISPAYGKGMSAGGPGREGLPAAAMRSGKIRKGVKKAQFTTKGKQLYPTYEKKSGAAKSFRKTFKDQYVGGKKSFTWDGRSYSCKKK